MQANRFPAIIRIECPNCGHLQPASRLEPFGDDADILHYEAHCEGRIGEPEKVCDCTMDLTVTLLIE